MLTRKPHLIWLALVLALTSAASGCANKQQETASTADLLTPTATSRAPLPPAPSAQQQRVEMILQRLDSELEGLLNLLPPLTTSTPAPTR